MSVIEPRLTKDIALGCRANCDVSTLWSGLDHVVEEFPDDIKQRGINRNWHGYRFVLRQLSRLLQSNPVGVSDYLDLGSGAGVIPLVMASTGLNVHAIDTWDEYADEFNNLMGRFAQFTARFDKYGVQWTKHNIMRTPFAYPAQSFDLISLFDVLEHLPRPRTVLEEVHRLLRPNGLVVITLPNVANLRNRLRHVIGRTPHADDISQWLAPDFFGHYREMTMGELKETLSRFGFSVMTARYSSMCHWNTRLPNGRWQRNYQVNSLHQWAKLCYLLVTAAVPSFRYEMLIAGRKAAPGA
jgi:SAM-dependent methyltransferase